MLDPAVVGAALLEYAEEHLEWGSFSSYMNYRSDQRGIVYLIPALGPVTVIDYHDYDSHKNYDGWSEDIWIVFDVQGVLYRAKGTHSSYEGSDWSDELKIVTPKTREVTYYEDAE